MLKTTIRIDGMACGMCEAHINDVIRRIVPKVKKLKTSRKKGESTFLTEEAVDMVALKKAIQETGYTFVSAESAEV